MKNIPEPEKSEFPKGDDRFHAITIGYLDKNPKSSLVM